jgi:hypothetical protein
MPVGTIDILNLLFSRPSQLVGTDTQAGVNFTTALSESSDVIRIGLKFNSIAASETVTISVSEDNISYTPVYVDTRTNWAADEWYWLPMDPIITGKYIRVSTLAAIDVANFYLVNSIFDLDIVRYNRDSYNSLPNKQILGSVSTNYYYDRKTTPQVLLWPVPDSEFNHLTVVCHRQVQDIGTMTQEIELPERWRDAIIWQLAQVLCFELPGIEPTRAQMVMQMAAKNLAEVEMEEGDGSPIRYNVRMDGYTR